jgi:hypothetical protein
LCSRGNRSFSRLSLVPIDDQADIIQRFSLSNHKDKINFLIFVRKINDIHQPEAGKDVQNMVLGL